MSQRKKGAILGYFYLLLRNGSSFIMTPIMLAIWDKNQYGIFQLGATIAAYLALMDLGVQNSIIKFISQYRAEKNKSKENRFVGTIIAFYCVLSILIFLVGVAIYQNLPFFFNQSMNIDEITELSRIFIVLMFGAIFNLFFNVFTGLLTAYEKFSTIRYRDITRTVFRFVIIIVMLRMEMSPFYIVVADLIINIIFNLSLVWIAFFKIKSRPTLKRVNFAYFKSILNYSFFVYLNVIAIQLFWMVDNIIIGLMMSAAAVGVYSLGTLVSSYFQSFSSVIANVLMPGVVAQVTKGASNEQLLNEAVKIGRIKLIFFIWLTIGFIFLGHKFIVLWAGKDYELAYYIAVIVIIPQVLSYTHDVMANVMWAREKHQKFSVYMIFVALLNVLITIVAVKYMGLLGAAYSTAFAFVVGFLIFASIYYHKIIEIDMKIFYLGLFKGMLPVAIFTSIIAFLISFWSNLNWITLITQGLLLSIFYVIIVYFFGMNNYEQQFFKKLINRK